MVFFAIALHKHCTEIVGDRDEGVSQPRQRIVVEHAAAVLRDEDQVHM